MNECDDDHLFEENECAECLRVGKEINGFIYDEELNLHFCSESCRAEYKMGNEDEDDLP